MNETVYLLVAVGIAGLLTFLLRAVPFAIVKKLRRSKFVQKLGVWMPAGIILILALVVFRGQIVDRIEYAWAAAVALAVTIAAHFLSKRRTLISIIVGTTTYIVLINFF